MYGFPVLLATCSGIRGARCQAFDGLVKMGFAQMRIPQRSFDPLVA